MKINWGLVLTVTGGVLLAGAAISAARRTPSSIPGSNVVKKAAEVASGQG